MSPTTTRITLPLLDPGAHEEKATATAAAAAVTNFNHKNFFLEEERKGESGSGFFFLLPFVSNFADRLISERGEIEKETG